MKYLASHPRKRKRGVDLISDRLPFGCPCYGEPNAVSNAIDYAKHRSRSHNAVIRVYDETGNVIETHKPAGDFKQIGRFRGLGPKAGWLSCNVLTQTASVRQEIDCKMPPNYS